MRKKDFKSGIGDGERVTQKHREKHETLRKIKRDKALLRIRGVTETTVSNDDFSKALNAYKSVPTMAGLHRLLKIGSESQLATHLIGLLQVNADRTSSPVLSSLVRSLGSESVEEATLAMDCLLHVTYFKIESDERDFARLILEAGLLIENGVALAHVEQDTRLALDIWKLVVNLINICKESRDAVLHSPLFCKGSSTLPNSLPPFLRELQRKRGGQLWWDRIMVAILVSTIKVGVELPPKEFILTVWPFVLEYFQMMLPPPKRHVTGTEPEQDVIISDLCELLHFFVLKTRLHDEYVFFGLLMSKDLSMQFIPYLVQLIPRLDDPQNKYFVATFLVKLSRLSVPQVDYMTVMARAGALLVMIQLIQSASERNQRQGLLWVQNFCAESLENVASVLNTDVLATVLRLLNNGALVYSLKVPVINLMAAICNTCVHFMEEYPQRANGYLAALVNDMPILKTTIHFITTISDVEDLLTVLDLWYDLLKWEPQWVSAELEKYGAEDRLNRLLEHKNMEVFNRTEEVLNALQCASNKQEMMELDSSSSSFLTTRTTPFSF